MEYNTISTKKARIKSTLRSSTENVSEECLQKAGKDGAGWSSLGRERYCGATTEKAFSLVAKGISENGGTYRKPLPAITTSGQACVGIRTCGTATQT